MNKKTHNFRLGFHTSITGGISLAVERAVSLGCNTMQIFSHNPRQWSQRQISKEEAKRFKFLRQKHDINPVFIHASYLINLASHSSTILKKSIKLLSYELKNADALGIKYIVLHTGSADGENEEKARHRAIKTILRAFSTGNYRAKLLLEDTARKKNDSTSIKALAEIIDMCHDCIGGICIDTCHAFLSGYDLRLRRGIEKLLSEINRYIGLDKLKLIHLNDSKRPLGSGIDRHEHIGKGYIGIKGFKNILSDRRILRIPMIMETPKENDNDDKKNLKMVLKILSGAG